MNNSQRDQVLRMAAGGFSARDIASLTGHDLADVRRAMLDIEGSLILTKQRLLSAVPRWWKGDAASYRKCVEANFADVA